MWFPTTFRFRKKLGVFLATSGVLPLMLAVYLGNALSKFLTAVINGALIPIIGGILYGSSKETPMKDRVFSVRGIKINYGEIITTLSHLMMGLTVSYFFVKYFVEGYLKH